MDGWMDGWMDLSSIYPFITSNICCVNFIRILLLFFIHLFIHLLIQEIFIDDSIWSRQIPNVEDSSREKKQYLYTHKINSLVKETGDKKVIKN